MGVVCTEEVEIHRAGDIAPCIEGTDLGRPDVEGHRLMTQAVHAHGALAGIELTHAGPRRGKSVLPPRRSVRAARECRRDRVRAGPDPRDDPSRFRRRAPLAPQGGSAGAGRRVRHRYCYAAHGLTLPMQLLSRRHKTTAPTSTGQPGQPGALPAGDHRGHPGCRGR